MGGRRRVFDGTVPTLPPNWPLAAAFSLLWWTVLMILRESLMQAASVQIGWHVWLIGLLAGSWIAGWLVARERR